MANVPKERDIPLSTWLLLKGIWDSGVVGSARALHSFALDREVVAVVPSLRSISQRIAEWRSEGPSTTIAELREVALSEIRKRFIAQGVTDDKIASIVARGLEDPDSEIRLKYIETYIRIVGLMAPTRTEQRTDIHVHDDRAADVAYERRMREIGADVADTGALPGRTVLQVTDNTDDVEAGARISDALPCDDAPTSSAPGDTSQPNQDDR